MKKARSKAINLVCEEDFKRFVRSIIGLNNQQFHDDIDDNLSNPANRKTCITFPRGHGKSTHLSVAYPLWKIAKDHNLRILIVSATAQVSKSFLSEIIGHIDRNERYRDFAQDIDDTHIGVVPRMKNYAKTRENWSGDSIVIDREGLNIKDPTILAVGVFGSILSKRADIIIMDDLVNQENSATEAQRQKIIDWVYTTVIPVLVPGGQILYLGNTWHQDDLVAHMLNDPRFDYKKRMPAIVHESNHPELWQQWGKIYLDESFESPVRKRMADEFYSAHRAEMDDGVEILWPGRFSYQFLYMERLSNPYAFARMYMCDPSNRPDQKFKDEWLNEACRKGKHMKLQTDQRDGYTMLVTTEGLDLAISEKEHSDDTCRIILDRVKFSNNPEIKVGDVILRDIKRGKFSPNETKETVKWDYENIKPDGIRVESVAYQQALVRDLDDMGIPVHGHATGGEKNDPYIGINSIAIYFELGKFILPFDNTDPRTIELVSQLVNEMRAFPDGHTGDSLMATWFAFFEMRELLGDRIILPENNINPLLEPKPDISIPEVRQAEEKKADLALTLEQQHERQLFVQMMRGGR